MKPHVFAENLPYHPESPAPATGAAATALDPLSTRVIHLARDEAAHVMRRRNVWSRMGGWFLGEEAQPRPLANPRLEMLRSFTTSILTDAAQSGDLEQAMLDKGHYTSEQMQTVRRMARAQAAQG